MKKATWLYCTACERGVQSDSKNICKYDLCNGNLGDIWGWEVVRELNKSYLENPTPGQVYPLFGDRRMENLRRSQRYRWLTVTIKNWPNSI